MESKKIAKYALALGGFGIFGLAIAAGADAIDEQKEIKKAAKEEARKARIEKGPGFLSRGMDWFLKSIFLVIGLTAIACFKIARFSLTQLAGLIGKRIAYRMGR